MDVTLRDLENYLAEHYHGRRDEQGLFMKLVEEMGETAEVLNMRSGRKSVHGGDLKEQLASELADIIHYTVAIAAVNDIDLEKAILEKDRRAAVKYGHARDLETFLKEGCACE